MPSLKQPSALGLIAPSLRAGSPNLHATLRATVSGNASKPVNGKSWLPPPPNNSRIQDPCLEYNTVTSTVLRGCYRLGAVVRVEAASWQQKHARVARTTQQRDRGRPEGPAALAVWVDIDRTPVKGLYIDY